MEIENCYLIPLEHVVIQILLLTCLFYAGDPVTKSSYDLTGIKCIVSGEAVHKQFASEFKQGKIFFNCNDSRLKYKADSAAFIIKANHQLVVSGQYVQSRCPIKPVSISTASKVEHCIAGVSIRLCCPGCRQSLKSRGGISNQLKYVFSDEKFKSIFVPRPKTAQESEIRNGS